MRERGPEFHPLPEEPDKVETPAAANKRKRPEREALQARLAGERDLSAELNALAESEESKAA